MMSKFLQALRALTLFLIVSSTIFLGMSWLEKHYQTTIEASEETVHQIIGNPYIHMGDGKPNNRAHPGDLIYVHNKYIKSQRCHVQVANLLINTKNDDVMHFSTFQNWFGTGTFTANEMFALPDWLPPGTYRVVKKSTSFCGDRVFYFTNFDVILEVTPLAHAKPKVIRWPGRTISP
uniref:hypothetical protein n=1 Tax=Methylobacterium sp. B34 TaxID=95563 RepID=UPI00034A804E|nr:hypothetical protein [Methylobacterium sp. B34]